MRLIYDRWWVVAACVVLLAVHSANGFVVANDFQPMTMNGTTTTGVDGTTSNFHAAVYTITQAALDEAPNRYAKFVTEALQQMEASPLPNYGSNPGGCNTNYMMYGTKATKKFTLDPGSLKFTLTDKGVHVVATGTAWVRLPVYYRLEHKAFFHLVCIRKTICNGWVTVNFKVAMSGDIIAQWNRATGSVVITSSNVAATTQHVNYVGCSIPGWLRWFVNVDQAVTEAFNDGFKRAIASLSKSLDVPTTFSPYNRTFVSYQVRNLTMYANKAAVIAADCNVTATVGDPVVGFRNVTFSGIPLDDAKLWPPDVWPTTYSKGKLFLLNGLRMSSSMLTAMMWAAQVTGGLDYSWDDEVLDAHIHFNVTWSKPFVGVPKKDYLYLEMDYGVVNGTCGRLNHTLNESVVLFYFYHLKGHGFVNYTGDDSPGFEIVVTEFDFKTCDMHLVAPRIPLPERVVQAMARKSIAGATPALNSYLELHAFKIPPDLQVYTPHPTLHIVPQPGCCQNMHGYVDIVSTCSTNKQDKWPCMFPHVSDGDDVSILNDRYTGDIGQGDNNDDVDFTPKDVVDDSTAFVVDTPAMNDVVDMTVGNGTYQVDPVDTGIVVNVFSHIANGSNAICDLSEIGQQVTAYLLPNTAGACVSVPRAITVTYYSMHKNKLNLLCKTDKCEDCVFTGVDATTDKCVKSAHANASLYVQTQWKKDCLFVGKRPHDKYAIMFLYERNSVCENATAPTTPSPVMVNIGPIDGQCRVYDPTSSFGHAAVRWNDVGGDIMDYTVTANCNTPTCVSTTCQAVMNGSKCAAFKSGVVDMDSIEVIPSDVLGWCHIAPPPTPSPPKPKPHDGDHHGKKSYLSWLIPLSATLGTIYLVVLIGYIIYVHRNTQKKRAGLLRTDAPQVSPVSPPTPTPKRRVVKAPSIPLGVRIDRMRQSVWSAVLAVMVPLWYLIRTTFGPHIPSVLELATITWLLAVGGAIYVNLLEWTDNDPFRLFLEESIGGLGLPQEYIKFNQASRVFAKWSWYGRKYTLWACVLPLCFVAVRVIVKRPRDTLYTKLTGRYCILVAAGYMVVLTTPTVLNRFHTMVHIIENPDNFLTRDPGTRKTLTHALGYMFASIVISKLSSLFLCLFHAAPAANFLASVWFFVLHKWPSSDARSTAIMRSCVCAVMMHVLGPVTSTLSVIVSYQSLGVEVAWAVTWLAMWTVGMICVVHFVGIMYLTVPSAMPRQSSSGRGVGSSNGTRMYSPLPAAEDANDGNSSLGNNDNHHSPEPSIYSDLKTLDDIESSGHFNNGRLSLGRTAALIGNSIVYLIAYITGTWYVYREEERLRDLSIAFPISLMVATFACIAAATLLMLGYFRATDMRNEKRPNTLLMMYIADPVLIIRQILWIVVWLIALPFTVVYYCLAWLGTKLLRAVGLGGDEGGDGPPVSIVWRVLYYVFYPFIVLYNFVVEKTEHSAPSMYGSRVSGRRLFLIIGTGAFIGLCYTNYVDIISLTPKEKAKQWMSLLGEGWEWPSDKSGGTIFDPAFKLYAKARWWEWYMQVISCGLFVLALLVDFGWSIVPMARPYARYGLRLSRSIGFVSTLVMFCSMMPTAIPNYLRATKIDQICPHCAPKFTTALEMFMGNVVGLMCAGLFTARMLPVLICTPPALIRSSTLMLLSQLETEEKLNMNRDDDSEDIDDVSVQTRPRKRRNRVVQMLLNVVTPPQHSRRVETLRLVFLWSALCAPLVCAPALSMVYQMVGDDVVSVMILLFCVGPPIVAWSVQRRNVVHVALLWSAFYVGICVALAWHEGWMGKVWEYLQEEETWFGLLTEYFLANVVLSDMLKSLMD